jgi:hypothetical protein
VQENSGAVEQEAREGLRMPRHYPEAFLRNAIDAQVLLDL